MKTMPLGVHLAIQGSSAWRGRNPRQRFCMRMAAGAFLRDARQQRTYLSRRRANSTGTPRTNISVSSWHGVSEDTCQALAVPPIRKYENEGGPGAVEIVDLLRAASNARLDDVATFVDALIFNWLRLLNNSID